MVKKIEIRLGSLPSEQVVIVDGKDISELVFALAIHQAVGEKPRITLGIVAQSASGNPYMNDAKTGLARRVLQLEPDEVILEGEAALTELVANVDRYELNRRADKA